MTSQKITRLVISVGKERVYEREDGSQLERSGGTVAWRNNNPGNLKFGFIDSVDTEHLPRTKDQALAAAKKEFDGVVGLDQHGNAVFESYEAGRAAQIKLFEKNWGEKTVPDMLQKYSKPDYSGPTHYKEQLDTVYAVAANEGVDLHGKKINDLSPKEKAALADGVGKAEGWNSGYSNPKEIDPISGQTKGTDVSHAQGHADDDGVLKLSAHGQAVSALQADLAALGYTDNRGKPLLPDGHYGRNTEAAVMAFQSDHGLRSDGVAGKNTFAAIQGQRQLLNGIPAFAPELQGNPHPRIDSIDPANRAPAQRDLRAPTWPDTAGPAINPYADPSHPDHGLYAELRERIPNASENRIVECTAACHMAGIRSGELGKIHLRGKDALVFAPNGGAGSRAEVALTSPAPPIQQTVQHVKGFEQNQQMVIAQMNAQQQQTGPVMGGPRMG